jgi:hypothetical protein
VTGVAAGATVPLSGTVLNASASTQFFNATAFTVAPELTLDDTPFFATVPATLTPGGSASGLLFNLLVDAAAAPGAYAGSFTILGGAEPGSTDVLASASFRIEVAGPTATVPEPTAAMLLAAGLCAVAAVRRHRRTVG